MDLDAIKTLSENPPKPRRPWRTGRAHDLQARIRYIWDELGLEHQALDHQLSDLTATLAALEPIALAAKIDMTKAPSLTPFGLPEPIAKPALAPAAPTPSLHGRDLLLASTKIAGRAAKPVAANLKGRARFVAAVQVEYQD